MIQKRILIVEDEPEIRELLKEYLSEYFAEIEEAADGRIGLEKVQTCSPDVIISDYNMPNMDGLELLRFLQELNIEVPVIWLTGRGSQELFKKAWFTGVYDYFEKPVDLNELLECIKGTLSGERTAKKGSAALFMKAHQVRQLNLMVNEDLAQKALEHAVKKGCSISSLFENYLKTL